MNGLSDEERIAIESATKNGTQGWTEEGLRWHAYLLNFANKWGQSPVSSQDPISYIDALLKSQQKEIDRARRTVSNLVGGMCEHKESCQYPNCKCGKP